MLGFTSKPADLVHGKVYRYETSTQLDLSRAAKFIFLNICKYIVKHVTSFVIIIGTELIKRQFKKINCN